MWNNEIEFRQYRSTNQEIVQLKTLISQAIIQNKYDRMLLFPILLLQSNDNFQKVKTKPKRIEIAENTVTFLSSFP